MGRDYDSALTKFKKSNRTYRWFRQRGTWFEYRVYNELSFFQDMCLQKIICVLVHYIVTAQYCIVPIVTGRK